MKGWAFIRWFIFHSFFSIFIVTWLSSSVFADVPPIIKDEIKLSTPSPLHVLSGRISPLEFKKTSWKKYDYEAGFVLFGERHKVYPGVFILAGKGKNTLGLSYLNSTLPFIKDKYDFLRSNDIAVKRTVDNVPIKDGSNNIIGTSTYITDEISQFHSRTQILDLLYIRTLKSGSGKYKFGLIAGIPIAYNSYGLRCTLDNGTGYSESGSSFGAGLSAGLNFTAAESFFFSKGLVFSAGLIYRKIWFVHDKGDKISRPLRSEISGVRFFLNTAWSF